MPVLNFLKQTTKGKKVEASEASPSRNRKLPTFYRSNRVYNVAEEKVEEEEDIDDEDE